MQHPIAILNLPAAQRRGVAKTDDTEPAAIPNVPTSLRRQDRFDMAAAYRRCRSFRRMVNAFGLLTASVGITLEQWPPPEWMSP